MKPATVLIVQVGVLLATGVCVVGLARRGRTAVALTVAVGVTLAFAGVAWIALARMSGLVDLPAYDTTLRDGTQGEGVTFSVADKLRIAERLDAFGHHAGSGTTRLATGSSREEPHWS